MKYGTVVEGRFLARPNRFIAHVEVAGEIEVAHVKNTGRCRELLLPGVTVYLEYADNPSRKTKYSLIAVKKGELLINMDSQAPNKVVEEALRAGWLPSCWQGRTADSIRREVTYGDSRLDFVLQSGSEQLMIEVKGVTLEKEGAVYFPDAPTERGIKHIRELEHAVAEGHQACVLFVVQMEGARWMSPNDETHPAFGEALRHGAKAGVHICACACKVQPDGMTLAEPVLVRLH